MKTITVVLEVEYTCGRPDALQLAREIETKFSKNMCDGCGEQSKAIVRVVTEQR